MPKVQYAETACVSIQRKDKLTFTLINMFCETYSYRPTFCIYWLFTIMNFEFVLSCTCIQRILRNTMYLIRENNELKKAVYQNSCSMGSISVTD